MSCRLITIVLFSVLFQACATSRIQKMSSSGQHFTDAEIQLHSEDCYYVLQKIRKGLKKVNEDIEEGHSTFMRNDFLVSLLKKTTCLQGITKKQIIKLFGETWHMNWFYNQVPYTTFKYCILIEEGKYYRVFFTFKEGQFDSSTITETKVRVINKDIREF